jgi:hypothetical protein
VSAPDAPWRVYLKEWLIVYTSDRLEDYGQQECRDHFTKNYEGRIWPEDVQVRAVSQPGPQPQVLEFRLWNRHGEYKDRTGADELASVLEGSVVVQRGSEDEQELLGYSRKMLPG